MLVLQVTMLLLIALTIWLALLLLAVALCRGAAAADRRAAAASAKQYIHSAARPRTLTVAHTVTAIPRHGTPRRYYSPRRPRRGTKHAPRLS